MKKKLTWKTIPNYEGFYEISNTGMVRNRFEKILRSYKEGNGYMRIELNKNGSAKKHSIHRLVAGAFLGKRELPYEVNHINGNRVDNNVENLEWLTRSQNIRDTHIKGRHNQKSEKNNATKLTNREVSRIKLACLCGIKKSEISKIYNIAESTVFSIANGTNWKNINLIEV